jgi:hypothetical protein
MKIIKQMHLKVIYLIFRWRKIKKNRLRKNLIANIIQVIKNWLRNFRAPKNCTVNKEKWKKTKKIYI